MEFPRKTCDLAHLQGAVGLALCISRGSSAALHARLCEGGPV